MPKLREKRAREFVKKGKTIRQVAVLPYRERDGELEFLLMTSRQTKRFVLPKGWPMKGKDDAKAAAVEAEQEAGLVGEVAAEPHGSYSYWKRLKTIFVPITVSVYPMRVTDERKKFRESNQREKAWVKPGHARMLVDEPDLITLLASFEQEFAKAII